MITLSSTEITGQEIADELTSRNYAVHVPVHIPHIPVHEEVVHIPVHEEIVHIPVHEEVMHVPIPEKAPARGWLLAIGGIVVVLMMAGN